MGKIISVGSGKGGVGKTTVVANLGCAMAKFGKSVLLVDADIAMANLGMFFGLHSAPITLHDVLIENIDIHDAMYDGPVKGLKIVPSGLTLSAYRRADPEKIQNIVGSVADEFDYVLVDVPAGIGSSAKAALAASQEIIIVTAPFNAALVDAMKMKMTAEHMGIKPMGAIINLRRNEPWEAKKDEVESFLEMKILGEIPEDPEVRKTLHMKHPLPVVVRKEDSPAAQAFMEIAARMTGKTYVKRKKGLLEKLMSIFRRR